VTQHEPETDPVADLNARLVANLHRLLREVSRRRQLRLYVAGEEGECNPHPQPHWVSKMDGYRRPFPSA
jgi:hypothetical protein